MFMDVAHVQLGMHKHTVVHTYVRGRMHKMDAQFNVTYTHNYVQICMYAPPCLCIAELDITVGQ